MYIPYLYESPSDSLVHPAPTAVTDRDLLEGLRRGEQEAFAAIFRNYYPALVRVATGMVRDSAIGEELAQDVFLELWRRHSTLQVEDSLRAYLFRSVRNRALNHIRHENIAKRKEPLLREPDVAPAGASTLLEEAEMGQAVRVAVANLPDRCREVFEMSRVDGLRYAEIAGALGISVKGVEAQMGKALRLLRESLATWLP